MISYRDKLREANEYIDGLDLPEIELSPEQTEEILTRLERKRLAYLDSIAKLERGRLAFLDRIRPHTDRAFDEGKRSVQRNAASKKNEEWRESREWCIRRAAEIWEHTQARRIGEVAAELAEELVTRRMYAPTPVTLAGWLRDAAKAGLLVIPQKARRRGRSVIKPRRVRV